ncbi:MAG: hypothetical protein LBR90_03375, partial [Elusimicrobiota bacterium]|nr:hypothetical protein [Elusimicrobiota bacterium]
DAAQDYDDEEEQEAKPLPFSAQEQQSLNDILSKKTLTPDHSLKGANPKASNAIKPVQKNLSILPTTSGKIISAIDSGADARPKKDNIIFVLTAVMLIIVGVALYTLFFTDQEDAAQAQVNAPRATEQEQEAFPYEPPPQEPAQTLAIIGAPITNRNGTIVQKGNEADRLRAMQAVKSYALKDSLGTMEQYFTRTYQGYNTRWSADYLGENSYTVEFVATQIRKEPIFYLFRVNVINNEIVGLNNISLNLLS